MELHKTTKIKRGRIPEKILIQIADNLLENLYLVFYAEVSMQLDSRLKDQILADIILDGLKSSITRQADFPKFYRALKKNVRANLDHMVQVKRTGLISTLAKQEMIINLMLDRIDHEMMAHFPEENLDEDTLCMFDEMISMYGDFPPLFDPLGREIRIQLHIIKNSTLHFADPEKKAELIEELLMQSDAAEFREFFIINALQRAMNTNAS